MSPLEREVKELRELVTRLLMVEDVRFIENLKRRVISGLDVSDLPPISLSNLSDVGGTDSPSDGQVLKYDGVTDNRWEPGTDNIA